VDYTTTDGSANAGSDYTAKTGTVTFSPGVMSMSIQVPVIGGDRIMESDKTFMVALSNAQSAIISDTAGTATVTITNDDDDASAVIIGKGFIPNGGFDMGLSDLSDFWSFGTDLNDYISCLGGDDSVNGGNGDNFLIGGMGDDTIDAGDGDDTIVGSEGSDRLSAGGGFNIVLGGDGDDYIESYGANTIDGGAGNDLFSVWGGGRIDGGAGNDSIAGSMMSNLIFFGGDGDDDITIDGNSTIDGGAGNDRICIITGMSSIDGGAGNDNIFAGGTVYWYHHQTIFGGSGDDVIGVGGDFNDALFPGFNGDDLINGGTGVDILYGGGGDDTFIFNKGDSGVGVGNRDIIEDFNGVSTGEVIDLRGMSDTALTFKVSAAFSGANQVRYVFDFTNKETIIQVNLDSNTSTTELEVKLVGLIGLVASDFVLVTPV